MIPVNHVMEDIFPPRLEINELKETLTLVAFRDRGSYGNVSLFLYAQNLEAQLGLDFNIASGVRTSDSIMLFTITAGRH